MKVERPVVSTENQVNLNDYQKVNDFLSNNGIFPILYGSLGVSVYLGNFKKFGDIDLLIEDSFLNEKWNDLIIIMNNNGFKLIDEDEHEFVNNQNINVAFAKQSILQRDNICDLQKDIQTLCIDGVTVRTLSKEAFIRAYTVSAKDGYRKNVRGKKDLDIINRLKKIS